MNNVEQLSIGDCVSIIASTLAIICTIWMASQQSKIETITPEKSAQSKIETITPEKSAPIVNQKGSTKQEIARLFYHERNSYSAFKINEDKLLELDHKFGLKVGGYPPSIKIICDVPEGKSMWYEGVLVNSWAMDDHWEWLTIHIHSPIDINGGGWNHGKFGNGQTNVIE